MRKIIYLFLLFMAFQSNLTYAAKDCVDLESQYNTLKEKVVYEMDQWKSIPKNDAKKATQGKILSDLLAQGVKVENDYNDCLGSVKKINELMETYFTLGDKYFAHKQWDRAIEQYKEIIKLEPSSYQANYNIGSCYLNKGDLNNSLAYYQHAQYSARWKTQLLESKNALARVRTALKNQEKKEGMLSDDPFSRLQYYLRVLNITEAWKKITQPKEVIVAVIDDGININHPDLTDHIWVEKWAPYWSSKIKDFVGDKVPDNLPTGEHGTMIAWIIAATTDNKVGVAGIAKNVKIMPLRVFDFKGNASEVNIIKAMNYAIDNHANIINLSLGQTQFAYSTKYDEVIKRAYENGIIVVIAAGNGDVLAYNNNGVNTSVNQVSPVCNNSGNKKYSFGVEAIDEKWSRTRWSNYGACVSFSAPGENIFSTSISVFNKESGVDYDTSSGTSFSAPMIAGIIALGYNKYWYVSPDTVYAALNESKNVNDMGIAIVDAAKYLNTLEKKTDTIKKEQVAYQKTGRNLYAVNSKNQLSQNKEDLSRLSDGDFLDKVGLISKKNFSGGYMLNELVARQEAVAMAMRLLNIYLPPNYTCKNIYKDVTTTKPNTWACQVIEAALEKGIVTNKTKLFNPEEKISLIETLQILMKAASIEIDQYSGGEFESWQTNVLGTALHLGIIDPSINITPSKKTLRSELFKVARKIYLLQK